MTSPYLNTELYTKVSLYPNQMNNDIYLNLKKNLEYELSNRCFKNYGFIMKIFKILGYKDGIIEAENLGGSASFDITFSCRICKPLKNMQIICQVDKVNKLLITAVNGPILVIITNDRTNSDVFFMDGINVLRYKKEKSHILKSKQFVKVTLISITFNDKDNKIKAIGFLEDMATDDEIKMYYKDLL